MFVLLLYTVHPVSVSSCEHAKQTFIGNKKTKKQFSK